MPVEFTIDHEHAVVHATANGHISKTDLLGYIHAKAEAGAITYAEVFDARKIVPDLTLSDLLAVEHELRECRGSQPPGKVAAVINDPFHIGLGRAYAVIAREENPRFELFDDIEPAERWLAA